MDSLATPFEREGPRRMGIAASCLFGLYALVVNAMKYDG